ncbi:TonB-dependent siderophore receptor [Hyphomicrobium sp. LHD-15]|uniref:TonB-dependent siderophore receptor n=1 Tax=Hyphomicrobium sp. LHD-15 TaxID=3072142 RepID=UPI00280D0786|nr:TonB-dependent siderophore receptor [Hyphomicrobium sp. LHD-15]MDQ8700626.1 TonB-dependent siderophore receptor [Hyphomicrobium sp. LHD-15]
MQAVGFSAIAQTAPSATQLPAIEVQTTAKKVSAAKKFRPKGAKVAAIPKEPAPEAVFGAYNPALDLKNLELPPGTTLTTAGPVDGYRALSAVSATKTATPLSDIPQSIQVIPKSVIKDQGSLGVGEVIQNVSGVIATNDVRTPGYDFITVRGFEAEQWVDGLGVFYNLGHRDALANIERIEILKGPNAILYGGGNGAPIGGAVNVISKMPTNRAGGEFGVTVGSESYARPYFDIDQPISADGSVLFRLTGDYAAKDSFIEVIESERYSINPTLTLTNKVDTTLTIQGRATHWQQQEYQGLPAVGTVAGDFDIRRTLFVGPQDAPASSTDIRGITTSFDHKANDAISVHAKARWSEAGFRQLGQLLVGSDGFRANEPLLPPSSWLLTNTILDQNETEFVATANVQVKTATELTKSTFLLGADYSHITDEGFIAWDAPFGGAGIVDLQSPSFPTPYVNPGDTPATTFGSSEKTFVNEGLYLQAQISVADRVHLLGGLRLAHVDISANDRVTGVLDAVSETRLLPRVGALFDLDRHVSVYASYSQGLKGQPLISHSGAPAPEHSEQKEVGLKFAWGDFSGTAAIFEIVRSNVPVLDGFVTVDTSEERSRGFETDLIWQPSRNWRVLASYSFTDAVLLEPTTGAAAGNRLAAVPEHSGRLWVHHAFEPPALRGWSMGAGVYAVSDQAIEYGNSYFADGYFKIDARLGYDNETISAGLSIKNLTDEEYFVPYDYFRGRVAPAEPRMVYGTISYKY